MWPTPLEAYKRIGLRIRCPKPIAALGLRTGRTALEPALGRHHYRESVWI